jgi:hypothetical protein
MVDYGEPIQQVATLRKELNELLAEGKYKEAEPLAESLLVQSRMLLLSIKSKLESNEDNHD